MNTVILVMFLAVLLFSVGVSADEISEYGSPFFGKNNACWTESNGRLINVSPCTYSSVTGHTRYDVTTNASKVAFAFDDAVAVNAFYKKTKQQLVSIYSGGINVEYPLYLSGFGKHDSFVLTDTIKDCEYGRGSVKKQIQMVFANLSTETYVICYDKSNVTGFFETRKELSHSLELRDFPVLTPAEVTMNNDFGSKKVYEYSFANMSLQVDWLNKRSFNARSGAKKFWVVGYDVDLFAEVLEGTATVLDPFFNTSFSNRVVINISCAGGVSADAECRNNETVQLVFDHNAMVQRGVSQLDGDDIRIVFANDSTIDDDQIEIARINITGWNQTNTTLLFKLQGNITAGTNNASYYMYYNNSAAGTPDFTISQVIQMARQWNLSSMRYCIDFDNMTTAIATNFSNACKSNQEGFIFHFNTTNFANIRAGRGVDVITGRNGTFNLGGLHQSVEFDSVKPGCLQSREVDSDIGSFNNATISLWILRNATGGSTDSIIFDQSQGIFRLRITGGAYQVNIIDAGVNEMTLNGGASSQNVWEHLAFVYYFNGTGQLYKNATLTGTAICTPAACDGIGGAGAFRFANQVIGCNDATRQFSGRMDEIIFFNASLSSHEISNIYNWTKPRFRNLQTTQGMNISFGPEQNNIALTNVPIIVLNSTTVLPNGTLAIALNGSTNVFINVTYQSDVPNDGNMTVVFFVNGSAASNIALNITALFVRANSTHQFNLTEGNYSRNSTIYVQVNATDNTSRSALGRISQNVTIYNVPPEETVNISLVSQTTIINGLRTRENITFSFNVTGDFDGDPVRFTTSVNGTRYCGINNVTSSCDAILIPRGENNYSIATNDGQNTTNVTSRLIFIDEYAPQVFNISNFSITISTARINISSNEPVNISISFGSSSDCSVLGTIQTVTTFQTNQSVLLSGLVAGTQYCYRVTVGDNTTSHYGHLTNLSGIFNFTTTAAAAGDTGGGGGGGGGGQVTRVTQIAGNLSISPARVEQFTLFNGNNKTYSVDFFVSIAPDLCESLSFGCTIGSGVVSLSKNLTRESVPNQLVSRFSETFFVKKADLQVGARIGLTVINLDAYIPMSSQPPKALLNKILFSVDEGKSRGVRFIPLLAISVIGFALIFIYIQRGALNNLLGRFLR